MNNNEQNINDREVVTENTKMKLNTIFAEIYDDVFHNFAKLDKEIKRSFLTDSVKCWGFRNEDKARKFIEQTHVIRGEAIIRLLDYLKEEFMKGEKYYLKDNTLKKNQKKIEGIKLNDNLDMLKENLINYIKFNWGMFPIGINIYDNESNIGRDITVPDFIKKYNQLPLLEKINNLYNVIMESEKTYIELGKISDKLLDSLIFNDINQEINNLDEEKALLIFNKMSDIKFSSKHNKEINEVEALIKNRVITGENNDRNVCINFILKMSEYTNKDNILCFMNYMINTHNIFNINELNKTKFIRSIKDYMFDLNMEDRNNFVKKYEGYAVKTYLNKKKKSTSIIARTLNKANIKFQIDKGEVNFDNFVNEKTEAIWKKSIKISSLFGKIYLNVDLSVFTSDKIKIRQKSEEVEIEVFSDFEIKISNREFLDLLTKTINDCIEEENLKSKPAIYKEYDFNNGINNMLNTLRLEQKIKDVSKQEIATKKRRKI